MFFMNTATAHMIRLVVHAVLLTLSAHLKVMKYSKQNRIYQMGTEVNKIISCYFIFR